LRVRRSERVGLVFVCGGVFERSEVVQCVCLLGTGAGMHTDGVVLVDIQKYLLGNEKEGCQAVQMSKYRQIQ
jgi:hypothetical protein